MFGRVYVEVTNLCNMRCSFCHGHSRPGKQMTLAEFSQVLQKLQGHTQYIYYHLMGEPLTHPRLPEFLKLAREMGFRSIITTNGTLVHSRGMALVEAGLHKISISIHSFEGDSAEDHAAYLTRVADFAKAAAAAGTIVCLRLWNRDHDDGRNDTALRVLRQQFPETWTENSRGYRLRERLFLEWGDRFDWPDLSAPEGNGNIGCLGMRDQFGILCDGTVVPCCLDSEGSIAPGNIFTQELTEILASPRAKAIAEGFARHTAVEELCRRCGYARRFQ